MKNHCVGRAGAALALLTGLLGFGGDAKAKPAQSGPASASFAAAGATSTPIPLVAYWDPWGLSQNRWWDIASYRSGSTDFYNQYNAFAPYNYNATTGEYDTASFKYGTNGSVTVSYDTAPSVPYFVAHISATGLKPNFAYQMKLIGKPVSGSPEDAAKKGRGFGPYTKRSATKGIISVMDGNGEDWANETIGKIGRWWNDSLQGSSTNAVTDSVFNSTYPNETIYGYIFMGDFVTDASGNAEVDITGQNNYHITFQNWQTGGDVRMVQNGTPAQLTDGSGNKYFSITGSPSAAPYYGYGSAAPSTNVAQANGLANVYLWYQYESSMTAGRPQQVNLPPGQYRCRLMLTEESFHNNYGATSSNYGGRWKCVLATEDFAKDGFGQPVWDVNGNGQPDTNPNNDIVFNIRDAQGNLVAPPAAPTALSATTGADSGANPTINLSWTAPAGLGVKDYYKIKRTQTSGSLYTTIAGGVNTRSTSFSDATVIGGNTYYYVVSAVKSGVEGPNSAEISTVAPATPITLVATAGNASVGLSWTARAGATSYIVKRGAVTGGPYATVGTTTSSVTTYNNTGLLNGTPYYYVILAVNPTGPHTGSNEASATPNLPAPAAPSILTATAVSFCQIDVAWQDTPSNATSYEVERATNVADPFAFALLATVGANVRTYSDTNVPDNTATYYYRVRAVRDLGGGTVLLSNYSNTDGDSTGNGSVQLAAPANLNATAGDAQVSLSWTASGCATGYNVKRYDPTTGLVTVFYVEAPSTAFVDTGLTNGVTYDYVVSAVDAATNPAVESADSNVASATPGTPAAPSNLTATPAVSNQIYRIDLAWVDNATNETGFKIERAASATGPFTLLATLGANAAAYSDLNGGGGLAPATTYYYRVSAVNDLGASAYSAANATTAPPVAAAPTNLAASANNVGATDVTLTWTLSAGAASYNVKRSTTSGSGYVTVGTATTGSYADTAAKSVDTVYYYVVTAVNAAGESGVSAKASVVFLKPSDDAHVRAGSYANTIFGSATTLEVKTSTSAKENRDAYFKFSLNGISSVSSAKLWIYAGLSASGSFTTTLYQTSNAYLGTTTPWVQSGIKWSNKPALGSVLTTSAAVNTTTLKWYSLPVTGSYVSGKVSEGAVSMALHNGSNTSPYTKVNSRENTSFPLLVITGN